MSDPSITTHSIQDHVHFQVPREMARGLRSKSRQRALAVSRKKYGKLVGFIAPESMGPLPQNTSPAIGRNGMYHSSDTGQKSQLSDSSYHAGDDYT